MTGDLTAHIARGTTDREVRMEYYNPGDGKNRLRYEGIARNNTSTSTGNWVIRRLTWAAGPVAGDYVITRIQVLEGAWDNRAALSW